MGMLFPRKAWSFTGIRFTFCFCKLLKLYSKFLQLLVLLSFSVMHVSFWDFSFSFLGLQLDDLNGNPKAFSMTENKQTNKKSTEGP